MHAKTKKITVTVYGLLRANYFGICLATLLLTTVFWAFLGAQIQQQNADQLVNVSLLESRVVFKSAVLPDAHSFLFKWPLFLVISLLGSSASAFIIATILLCLGTVGALAYLLSRIEKRRSVLGLLYLALSSILLMIPAQPVAGALLPVNMAMLTTRNLEYILFICGLVFVVKARSFKTKYFWASVAALCLLFASDKLFIYLSLGGSILAVIYSFIKKDKPQMTKMLLWLKASLLAILGAIIVMLFVKNLGLVNFSSLDAGPYSLAHNGRDLLQGLIYAGLGLLTNIGANPVYDVVVVKDLLPTFFDRFFELTTVPFAVNFGIVLIGIYAGAKMFFVKHKQATHYDKLALTLAWSSVSAVFIFVATNHYYAVDGRYLGLFLFAIIICLATHFSRHDMPKRGTVKILTNVLLVSIVGGLLFTYGAYRSDRAALLDIKNRNASIVKELKKHSVELLVGDYWRVEPIKNVSHNKVKIRALDGCTTDRKMLSSSAASAGLQDKSTAYLLTFEQSSTGFPGCTLAAVVAKFGQPSSSRLISGTLLNPKEIILFYDKGFNKNIAAVKHESLLFDHKLNSCKGHRTLNIVAHTDDDLLFINPDIQKDINRGSCVVTIFVTAGDTGLGRSYSLKREQGVMAAYSNMLGNDNLGWHQQPEILPGGQVVSVAAPLDDARALLIFLRIPDGNLFGQGFAAEDYASLSKLYSGELPAIKTIDSKAIYTYGQLLDTFKHMFNLFEPVVIRTQNKTDQPGEHRDHSDHLVTGALVERSYLEEGVKSEFVHYSGYPTRDLTQNIIGDDLDKKTAAFLWYAKFDSAVCQSPEDCYAQASYGSYLKNQQYGTFASN